MTSRNEPRVRGIVLAAILFSTLSCDPHAAARPAAASGAAPPPVKSDLDQCLDHPKYEMDPTAPGFELTFTFQDKMTDTFRPEHLCVLIDDRAMFSADDQKQIDAAIGGRPPLTWKGRVAPGKHTLYLGALWRGYGEGEKAYLRKVSFFVSTHHAVVATAPIELDVTSFEQPAKEVEDRPRIEWTERAP